MHQEHQEIAACKDGAAMKTAEFKAEGCLPPLCYRTLGFRLFSGKFVTSYQNADVKDNPTLTLIALTVVLWQ